MKSFKKLYENFKLDNIIDLQISKGKLEQNILAKATVIGHIKAIDYFKKMDVAHLINGTFNIEFSGEKIVAVLTPSGRRIIRIRLKEDPDYLKDVTAVLRKSYKEYFAKLK